MTKKNFDYNKHYLKNFFFGSAGEDPILQKEIASLPFIVFDIETTGGNPLKSGIIEIAAYKFENGKVGDRYYTMVNPRQSIPGIVRRLTGISNRDVKDAPKIEEVYPDFLKFIGGDPIVSHNCQSDIKFLRYYSNTICDQDFFNLFLCTHLLGQLFFPASPKKNLKGLVDHLGLAESESHRADGDAKMTAHLFHQCMNGLLGMDPRMKFREALFVQNDYESIYRVGSKSEVPQLRSRGCGFIEMSSSDHAYHLVSRSLSKDLNLLSRPLDMPKNAVIELAKSESVSVKRESNIIEVLMRLTKEKKSWDNFLLLPEKSLKKQVLPVDNAKSLWTIDPNSTSTSSEMLMGSLAGVGALREFALQVFHKPKRNQKKTLGLDEKTLSLFLKALWARTAGHRLKFWMLSILVRIKGLSGQWQKFLKIQGRYKIVFLRPLRISIRYNSRSIVWVYHIDPQWKIHKFRINRANLNDKQIDNLINTKKIFKYRESNFSPIEITDRESFLHAVLATERSRVSLLNF